MARVKLSDVIIRANTKVDKDTTDLIYYVGGEHFEYENVRVRQRGLIEGSTIGPMFYYGFKAGDFLLVSRNPHLRKAGIVDFDGICSEKTFVLATADESVLLPRFLPFILQNETFWTYAFSQRHGSTNTFINWSTLAEYTFELPPIEVQRKLSDVLWGMIDAQEAYKALISKTDELVKSQFIAEFGDPRENPNGYSYSLLRDIADITSGITKGRKTKGANLVRVPYICTANVQNGYIDWSEIKYLDATIEEISLYSLCNDDVLMIEGGDPDKVGRGCLAGQVPEQCIYQNHVFRVRLDKDAILPEFFARYILLPSTKQYFLECAKQTTGIATINKRQLSGLGVMYPPMNLQKRYLATAQQLDKSKFVAQKATRLLHCML